jgi:hypothetical protein
MKNEIVIYQDDEASTHIEVRIEDETVWLSQTQMVELFRATRQNISLHINNIFRERELTFDSTVKEYLTVQKEGNRVVRRKLSLYNLDVIISVGYRVKSQRGTQFRIWANRILKDYLLKGYAISQRVERIEYDMHIVQKEIGEIKLQLNTSLPPNQGIFYDGQIFDAYAFVSDLIKSAKRSILLIDNYIDESVLILLSKREKHVKAALYTQTITKNSNLIWKSFTCNILKSKYLHLINPMTDF